MQLQVFEGALSKCQSLSALKLKPEKKLCKTYDLDQQQRDPPSWEGAKGSFEKI